MNIHDVSLEDCQRILERASNSSLHDDEETYSFDSAFDVVKAYSFKTSEVAQSRDMLIKCCAATLWILKVSLNIDECLQAIGLYINLLQIPIFGSLGCRSLGIRKFIVMQFSRVVTKTLKGIAEASTFSSSNIVETDTNLEEFSIEVVSSSQTEIANSRRPRRVASTTNAANISKKATSTAKKGLSKMISSLNESIKCLIENADEDFTTMVAELLPLLSQLAIYIDELKDSDSSLNDLFKSFASLSSETVLALHQSIMPALGHCFDRSSVYAESAKLRSSTHCLIVDIYGELVGTLLDTKFTGHAKKVKVSTSANVSFDSSFASAENAVSRTTTPAKSVAGSAKSTPGSARSRRGSVAMDIEEEMEELYTGRDCLLGTLQRMTLLCPDRAQVRQVVAKSISSIVHAIGLNSSKEPAQQTLTHFFHFLTRLAKSSKAQHRSFALDIICNTIQEDYLWKEGVASSELLMVLVARCSDQSPAVRLKALSTLYDFTLDSEEPNKLSTLYDVVKGSDTSSLLETVRQLALETKPMIRAKALQLLTTLLTKEWVQARSYVSSADGSFTIPLTVDDVQAVASGCSDVSVAVRKQTVQCLSELLRSHPTSDAALTAWVQTVLPLVLDTESTVVQKVSTAFEDIVLSGLADEIVGNHLTLGWRILYKIGELNMVQVLKAVIGHMIRNGIIVFEKSPALSFYRLVNLCKLHCEAGLSQYESLASNEQLLCCYEASWILMESFAAHCAMKLTNGKDQIISVEEQFRKVGSTEFIFHTFQRHCSASAAVGNMNADDNYVRILKVLDKFVATFSDDDLTFIATEIDHCIMSLAIPTPVAALMISIRFQISKVQTENASGSSKKSLISTVTAWTAPLLESIFQTLNTFAFGEKEHDYFSMITEDSAQLNKIKFVQIALFIIGELSMLGFKLDEAPLKMQVKSFATSESQHGPLATITQDDTGCLRIRFASRLSELLQLLMAKTLPGDGRTQVRCPSQVRAIAFITVGKLCMRDHILAREVVNVFLRELSVEDEPENHEVSVSALTEQSFMNQTIVRNSVRNNALLVLADLCVRHTHLVDRHIDNMACCLQDRDPMIRKNALVLISQLLMQDYVKLKGLLLYRFLMLTVDEEEELAFFARDVIERSLSLKYPGILVNHFSEAFIILNKCSEHPIYSAVAFAAGQDNGSSENDNQHTFSQAFDLDTSAVDMDPNTKAFHAAADINRQQRFQVYNFMATNINDETKIQITAKLVNDILASAVDHCQRLLPDRNNVAISTAKKGHGSSATSRHTLADFTRFETAIEDVLIFLRSPVLKIGSSKRKNGADGTDDTLLEDIEGGAGNPSSTAGQLAQAKTKILKALSSQHMISHILPVVMSLKHCLEHIKSPLQGALMEYLLSLVKQHASEVEQALQYDPTLKAEIDFDLRQYERQRKEQQQQAAIRHNVSHAPSVVSTARKATPSHSRLPALDGTSPPANTLLPSTVQKPVLKSARKSLTGSKTGERAVGSVRFHNISAAATAAAVDEEDDPMLRLMSQPEDIHPDDFVEPPAAHENISAISNRLSISTINHSSADLSDITASDSMFDYSTIGRSGQKRRSWGVVVSSLGSTATTAKNEDADAQQTSPSRKRVRRNSKSRSPPQSRKSDSAGDHNLSDSFGDKNQPVFLKMKSADAAVAPAVFPVPVKQLDSLFAATDVVTTVAKAPSVSALLGPAVIPVPGAGKRSAKITSNSLMGFR